MAIEPFVINGAGKWSETIYHSMLGAIQKLPQPTFHSDKFISPQKKIVFTEQRAGVYATSTHQEEPVDFFATHGTNQCVLVYMYTDSGERLFIHLDNMPCALEAALGHFKNRKIHVILAGGNTQQDADFHSILKPFLESLHQLSQTQQFNFDITKQMLLKHNQFDQEKDADAYAIDFLLRKANFLHKQVFHELLPRSVVDDCLTHAQDHAKTLQTISETLLNPLFALLKDLNPIHVDVTSCKKMVLTKEHFYKELKTFFNLETIALLKSLTKTAAILNNFSFPKTRMRSVGVDLKSGDWYQCSEVMDQRSNRYIRALRILDTSWMQMPHIYDATGNSLNQIQLHPNFSKIPDKLMDVLKQNFANNLDGLYAPAMITFMRKVFRFDQMPWMNEITITYAIEDLINFLQLNCAKDAKCLASISFVDATRL